MTAKNTFYGENSKKRNWFLKDFDWWISGFVNNNKFHGWNKSQYGGRYTNCFVFKTSDGDRIYGFLCHPKKEDPGYQFCVLVTYDGKNEWETEEINLRICLDSSQDISVRNALRRLFPDLSQGGKNAKGKKPLDRKKHR